jgi:hypothetical protein
MEFVMRFFVSDMENPSPWKEVEEIDERKVIKSYFHDNIKIYDADNSGEETYYFAFSSGKYFKLVYQWWIEYRPDWTLMEKRTIIEIKKEEAEDICADRNWLTLSR